MAMKFNHLCDSSTPLWSEPTSTNMEGNLEQMEFLEGLNFEHYKWKCCKNTFKKTNLTKQ